MPLKKSKSKKAVSENIRREKKEHPDMSNAQAAAIAYNVGAKRKKKSPAKSKGRKKS